MEMPDPTEMSREVSHHLHDEHESRLKHDIKEIERDWLEIVVALVLAFAAVASAWSAYEAARWGTRGSALFAEASTKRAESIQSSTLGGQLALADVTIYTQWFQATLAGNKKLATEIRVRMTPELSAAMDRWLAGKPPNTVPPGGPFRNGGYVIPKTEETAALSHEATALLNEGEDAHNQANHFVLVGVLFAITLFFGAISGKFSAKPLRTAMVIFAVVAFTTALVALLAQPQIAPWVH
jgi:hypothetical protein